MGKKIDPNIGKKTQFKKGQSGNPKGRPKLPDLREIMQKVLGEEGQNGMTAVEVIFLAQRAKAIKGDTKAAEWLMDHGYGKIKQTIDMNGSMEIKNVSETKFIIKKKGK